MPKSKVQSGPRAKREARLLRNAQTRKSRRNVRTGSTSVEKASALALENTLFKLPPIDDIFNESLAEYVNVVQDLIKEADRSAEFEIVHALMVYFYNRKPAGRALK